MRLGLDIGGTKIDAVVLDDDGGVRAHVRIPTGTGPEAVVTSAERAVREVVIQDGSELDDIQTIGVGIPGMVDTETGHVHHAVNLGVADLALADVLGERVGARVRVENDVKAASLGAYHLLQLDGAAALLNLGTGMAAGVVVNGVLWRGARGGAGEIGHIPFDPFGAVCSCGQRGCLETVASGSGLARMWPSSAPLPALELFDAADAGDPRALQVRRTIAAGVASALRVLVLTVDVELVVIGGGLSNLGDRLLAPVREVLTEWEHDSAFLRSLELGERVRMLPPHLSAAAVGAALIGSTETLDAVEPVA
ncbi:ROK family protein [Humibacter ginsenosidimutans]|uniref:ROK family protein n=1 Tax=Humibacter ginsenosidimutans TaxID=2599293 RepID=A0A5B8M3G7_9MICO|nr:ROK family protein [Humibacter ginsenosidimutans]QDZ14826.1 ROK family protein [Humibacter ginsenosidimutans]